MVREIRFLADVALSIISDRQKFLPWPLAGGDHAKGSDFHVLSDSGSRDLRTKTVTRIEAGEVLSINTAGGGGYGDPKERDAGAVARDVADGKVSPRRAREIYGANLPATE